ncbi:MAG: hypothetical protein LC753_14785, partial [Acidobacteria bacterium]|nr:hypothetical protein [Acidobacteriota bacterium]
MELIESRRYFFCRHCGSFHFPEPISAEGIRVLGRAAIRPLVRYAKPRWRPRFLDDTHPFISARPAGDYCCHAARSRTSS